MRRALLVLLESVFLLASLVIGGGPMVEGLRIVLVIVAAMAGAVIVFVVLVLAVGVIHQRQPPYPM